MLMLKSATRWFLILLLKWLPPGFFLAWRKLCKIAWQPSSGQSFAYHVKKPFSFKGHTSSQIDYHNFYYGIYDPIEFIKLNHFLGHYSATGLGKQNSNRLVVVGAHVGSYVIGLNKFFDEVTCFEPFPESFEALQKNIELQPLPSKFKAFNFGLGDSTRVAPYFPVPNSSGSGSFIQGFNRFSKGDPYQLRINDAKDVFEDLAPSVILVDTEGFEFKILGRIEKTLMSARPILFVEMDNDLTWQDFEQSNFCEKYGYKHFKPLYAGEHEALPHNRLLRHFLSRKFSLKPVTTRECLLHAIFIPEEMTDKFSSIIDQ